MPRPKGSKNKKTLERERLASRKQDMSDTSEYIIKKFIGRSSCGLTHNHRYVVKLEKNVQYGYSVSIIYDKTRDEEINTMYRVSNEQSFHHFFV